MSVAVLLKRAIPRSVATLLKAAMRSRYPYYCPVCNLYTDGFLPFGDPPRPHAACYECQALERDRLTALYMTAHPSVLRGRVLHFAPEPALSRLFREKGLQSVTIDLSSPRARLLSDITRLPFADQTFDSLYCSHVLEHVPDDRTALAECARVLVPEGHAIFQVPIRGTRTYEDSSITSAEARRQYFGQNDHVRYYGTDIADRFRAVGFDVLELSPASLVQGLRHSVIDPSYTAPLWICRRRVD